MQFFASCPPAVADLTAAELRACGATNTRELKLGVLFEGTLETAYRACLWSRTANRVFLELGEWSFNTADDLYAAARSIDWTQHIAPGATLACDFTGRHLAITHTHFGALRVKDAIVAASELDTRLVMRPLRNTERVLKNAAVDKLLEKERALGAALKFDDILPEVAGVYPAIMQRGEMDAGAWSCGMVAGLIHDVPSCKELIDRIMAEATTIIRGRLSGLL